MKLSLPFIISSETPDIKKPAVEAGIDYQTALEVWEKSKRHIEKMRKRHLQLFLSIVDRDYYN